MLSPGPPPALHRRSARLQPARGHSERPDPAGLRLRLAGAPRPWPASSWPEWAVRYDAGVGSEGRPRLGAPPSRGADTRAGTPRVALDPGRTQGLRGSEPGTRLAKAR